jgi:hypothetical protein
MCHSQAENVLALAINRGYHRAMETPKQILDTMGHKRVADAVGVDIRRVQRAAYEATLPAVWYGALHDLNGGPLPLSLFGFKRAT